MLQMKKTSIMLTEEDIVNIEEIIINESNEDAFKFLKNEIYEKVAKAQAPYDPLYGMKGYRRRPYGYRQII